MLLLQNQALQALSEARALVSSGDLLDLGSTEEEILDGEEDGVGYVITISRIEENGAFRVSVRVAREGRYFEVSHVVADPLVSFHSTDESPLPPLEELGRDGGIH